jgi:hypothetical protein
MPSALYRFERDRGNRVGVMSDARPSTEAVSALETWRCLNAGRSYTKTDDLRDGLEAVLHWSDADGDAGPHLEHACLEAGLKRAFLHTL